MLKKRKQGLDTTGLSSKTQPSMYKCLSALRLFYPDLRNLLGHVRPHHSDAAFTSQNIVPVPMLGGGTAPRTLNGWLGSHCTCSLCTSCWPPFSTPFHFPLRTHPSSFFPFQTGLETQSSVYNIIADDLKRPLTAARSQRPLCINQAFFGLSVSSTVSIYTL